DVKLVSPTAAATSTYSSVASNSITRNAPTIVMAAPVAWDGKNKDAAPMYSRDGHVVVVAYPLGKGQVIWWASAAPLSNAGISAENNMDLLLNSLGPAGGTTVLWDE